jgi:serine/threonine-protein kinase HipA
MLQNFSPSEKRLSPMLSGFTPLESDAALDLYQGAMDSPFYSRFGYYGQADFRVLADKIGLVPVRRDQILTQLLSGKEKVLEMIRNSFLSEEAKEKYIYAYEDKLFRMGMNN